MTFPCEVDVKVFARAGNKLEHKTRLLFEKHISPDRVLEVRIKTSKRGNYHSLSCKVQALNRLEMDNLYQALSNHPEIIMVL